MHEMSLAESVIQLLEESAQKDGFSKVEKIWLEIGKLSHVEPEAMRFCFDAVSKNTLANDAELIIIETPGEGWCMSCSKTIPYDEKYAPCPECGGFQVQKTGGDEMRVKELEVS